MKRNKFSLSYHKLLSTTMGKLVPIGITEVLPGDSFRHGTTLLLRTLPLLAPVMHPVSVKVHHFFVPFRLIWEEFEDFITGGPDGLNDAVFPTITHSGGSGAAINSLADYLGVPTGVNNLVTSALPFRAYNAIFNEFYRDQDLVSARALSLASGADSTTAVTLADAAWEKDYFTSARDFEQKGADIIIPIGDEAPLLQTEAPVLGLTIKTGANASDQGADFGVNSGEDNLVASTMTSFDGTAINIENIPNTAGAVGSSRRPYMRTDLSSVVVDLASASGISVNDLREALAMQRFQEARARYGSRYTEYLRYLGVTSSDARLQRPEYLGGGKEIIQFSEVLQTAEGDSPVGEMRGHGISAMRTNRYLRFFEEHGYVLSLLTVRPKTIYAQGLPRHWNRRTKDDFFQVELQTIGQQEILNKEVYAAHASPDARFGYQDRYDEYRRAESSVAGEFRDPALDHWHMARIFSGEPALNSSFVTCDPTTRIFAVEDTDNLYVLAKHSIQARRLLQKVGTSRTF